LLQDTFATGYSSRQSPAQLIAELVVNGDDAKLAPFALTRTSGLKPIGV